MNVLLGFLAGLVLGMGVNYLADVLPIARRLSPPICSACGAKQRILNYLFWPRNCPDCRTRRKPRTWYVELVLGILGVFWIIYSSKQLPFLPGMFVLAYLVLITVIDIEHRLILHITSLAGALGAMWVGLSLHGISSTLIGGVAGFGIMWLLYALGLVFIRISHKVRGKQITEAEAIGFGDVNLSGVIGLLLGWPGIILGLVITILLAGVISLIYLLWTAMQRKYHPNISLPYGPFLTISAFILLFIRPLFI